MGARLATSLVVAILAMASFASIASAQQVSPGGPDAQVSEYVGPQQEIGPLEIRSEVPTLGGQGPSGEVGSSGKLAFTGLWLLPLAALGITLAAVGMTMRRRSAATGLWLLPLAALGITLAAVGMTMRRRRAAAPSLA